jgi:hypothetical protein
MLRCYTLGMEFNFTKFWIKMKIGVYGNSRAYKLKTWRTTQENSATTVHMALA